MAYITGTTADVVEAQKSARSSLYGGKKWEEYFLQPTKQYYQAAGEAVQQQTAYDISQAYANYKQQELALLQQQQLGTGFKEQQSSALQSQYGQTYSGLKSTELQNLMNVESQYQSTLAKEEERLAKQASQYQKLDRAVQEYFKQYKDRIPGFEDIESFENLYDVDKTGTKTLSERGKLLYEAILKGGDIDTSQYDDTGKRIGEATTYSFDEYLQETDEDLYEMYLNDPDFAAQVISGSEYGDKVYSEEERGKVTDFVNEQQIAQLDKPQQYDTNKTFDTAQDKLEYATHMSDIKKTIDSWNPNISFRSYISTSDVEPKVKELVKYSTGYDVNLSLSSKTDTYNRNKPGTVTLYMNAGQNQDDLYTLLNEQFKIDGYDYAIRKSGSAVVIDVTAKSWEPKKEDFEALLYALPNSLK